MTICEILKLNDGLEFIFDTDEKQNQKERTPSIFSYNDKQRQCEITSRDGKVFLFWWNSKIIRNFLKREVVKETQELRQKFRSKFSVADG